MADGATEERIGVNGSLLGERDPAPVELIRGEGSSRILLVVDHAGRAVPQALGDLGVAPPDFERHIAWDIGAMGVTRRLGQALDATIVAQRYSRLVIDCNRTPGHPTSIAPISDGTAVPANTAPGAAGAARRVREIFDPYHREIGRQLDRIAGRGERPVLVAMHSFTPVMRGVARPWHAGVLFNHQPHLGHILLRLLEAEGDLVVGENEPYALSDLDDYTVPLHGERRGIPHVELEIRQDLIADEDGQAAWADRLARLLPRALEQLDVEEQSGIVPALARTLGAGIPDRNR
ncbi:N-formylglutamate amidohydrolase [Rhizosaccharibacter radicis]|uniref:N-formylglutamate amidohydrolase n=1 Tax=Rhizosaccharibacter radicis TaxID=2782605 RepID=A0ABT1VY30_9PROT|nr:N-formylglutamate amidohydrolase [Acetobacteraceae bacterium KSS12]